MYSRKKLKSSFKSKQAIRSTRSLELVHMDLCGGLEVEVDNYVFVIVDEFTKYTWTYFIASKDDAFESFYTLIRKLQKKLDKQVVAIRSMELHLRTLTLFNIMNLMGLTIISMLLGNLNKME